MPPIINFTLNGKAIAAAEGITVAAAIANHGIFAYRQSVGGEPRGPLCGMGICFECEVTVEDRPHVRSCQLLVRDGLKVETGA